MHRVFEQLLLKSLSQAAAICFINCCAVFALSPEWTLLVYLSDVCSGMCVQWFLRRFSWVLESFEIILRNKIMFLRRMFENNSFSTFFLRKKIRRKWQLRRHFFLRMFYESSPWFFSCTLKDLFTQNRKWFHHSLTLMLAHMIFFSFFCGTHRMF